MRILIVDDEPKVLSNLLSKLSRIDFLSDAELLTASSAKEAELIARDRHVDLLCTDIRMPVTDGITLIKRVKQRDPGCRILAVSGYDDYHYVRDAFLNGSDDYILKPVSMNELTEKLRKLLSIGFDAPHAEDQVTDSGLASRIKQYILYNYMKSITLKDLAQSMSVSYSHISHLFSGEIGCSFPAYLMRVRMEHAAEYLSDPDLSISEIALKVGFADANCFSRAYKKYYGMSCSEYRRSEPEHTD